jgi:hypothetical protein
MPSRRWVRLGNILCHITVEVAVSVIPLPGASGTVPLVVAVDRFLDRYRDDPGARATYAEMLTRLRDAACDQLPNGDLAPELYERVMARWDGKAANTYNKHLSALNSFAAYARRQAWLTTDPGRRLDRRKVTRARDKSIPRARLERLFVDDRPTRAVSRTATDLAPTMPAVCSPQHCGDRWSTESVRCGQPLDGRFTGLTAAVPRPPATWPARTAAGPRRPPGVFVRRGVASRPGRSRSRR